jgi:D-serine deaminase-like pyridoxal phosphate-dependent protein
VHMAQSGTAIPDLDTPALIVDLDLFERNLETMAAFFRDRPCGLRPHFKAHRTPEISRRQLQAGAIGITCAKLGEAEHLVDEGITSVLLANEVAGEAKIARLVQLSKRSDVIAVVDCRQTAAAISVRATHEGVRVGALVDLDIGMGRCGCAPGEPAADLVRTAADMPGLRFRGLMGYEGHLQLEQPGPQKERLVAEAIGRLLETKALVERDGIEVEIVSAGGTGTAFLTGAVEGVTEVQAGSYCLMDSIYKPVAPQFEQAAWVLATVISRPTATRAITDAGLKSLHPLGGVPVVKSPAGVTLQALHAEHGILELADEARQLRVGDKVEVYVGYLDGTMNLHERAYAARGEQVEDLWTVSGRGRSQ